MCFRGIAILSLTAYYCLLPWLREGKQESICRSTYESVACARGLLIECWITYITTVLGLDELAMKKSHKAGITCTIS